MACTRTGRSPSALAAARAPSSPISSRVLQRKITVCRRRPGLIRRTASTWAADPTRSSNDRAVARLPRQPHELLRHGQRVPDGDAQCLGCLP